MDDLAAAVVMSEGTEVRVDGAERALGLGVGGCHIAVEVERREVPHGGRRNLLDDATEESVAEECLNRCAGRGGTGDPHWPGARFVGRAREVPGKDLLSGTRVAGPRHDLAHRAHLRWRETARAIRAHGAGQARRIEAAPARILDDAIGDTVE